MLSLVPVPLPVHPSPYPLHPYPYTLTLTPLPLPLYIIPLPSSFTLTLVPLPLPLYPHHRTCTFTLTLVPLPLPYPYFGTLTLTLVPLPLLLYPRPYPSTLTLSLALTTLIFAIVVAIPLGILAAWKAGSWVDRTVMAFSVLGFSTPVFVLGYALIYIFALQLGLFPVQGFVSITDGIIPFLHRLVLPSITLSVIFIALFARITRASILEILNEDYIRTAKSKGLGERSILARHALPNAAVPIVTVIGIGFALLIGGVVVTESVYNIPGLGRLTVDAVLRRDYPVIQGIILVFSGLYVLVNLIIDLLYVALDPRIRF